MKIVVAYDGSLHAKGALKYGIGKARETGGDVLLLQIFNSSLFIDYGAGPMAEDIARSEFAAYGMEAERLVAELGSGVTVRTITEDGIPEDEILRYANAEKADLVLVPAKYRSVMKSAPCPVYAVPGTILVPVDNSDSWTAIADRVKKEAVSTASRVLLLGVVPVHLYSKWEKKEMEEIKASTAASAGKFSKMLRKEGIETKEIVCPGYPDEEILRAADKYAASMIMIPDALDRPSELHKAASIIMDDSESFNGPIVTVSTAVFAV